MLGKLKVLAVIAARGGSKGVPRKNIRPLGGKPLIQWSIDAAKGSKYVDRLILTTDAQEIADVARKGGCEVPFMRPPELALDDTPGTAPVVHALEQVPGFDIVVLLQPTSPLRTAEDIDRCLETLQESGAPACLTVRQATESPYLQYRVGPDRRMTEFLPKPKEITRRQDLPVLHVPNGAVYAARVRWFLEHKKFYVPETVAVEMPAARSVDIDTELDLRIAEALILRSPDS